MKKSVLILSLFLIQGCAASFSNVKHIEKDIWVSISYKRGSSNGNANAKIDKSVFNRITSGKIDKGWLELNGVYWESNGILIPQSSAARKWGYSDTTIIRIESINRIIPLSKEAIPIIKRDQ